MGEYPPLAPASEPRGDSPKTTRLNLSVLRSELFRERTMTLRRE